MKSIYKPYIFTLISLFFILNSCEKNEEESFFNSKKVQAKNLIELETQPNYNQGDRMTIKTEFPRILNDNSGQTIDVFASSLTDSYFYNISLFKKENNNWVRVNLSQNDVDHSSALLLNNGSLTALCTLNENTSIYTFSLKLILSQKGSFKLEVENLLAPYNFESKNGNVNLFIETNIKDLTNNEYLFDVN